MKSTTNIEITKVYEKELKMIVSDEVRNFVMLGLEESDEEFKEDKKMIEHNKKVIEVMREMMDEDATPGNFQDIMYAAVLLSDITWHSFDEAHKKFHPLTVRDRLKKLQKDLPPQLFDPIMTLIEEHEGVDAPHKKLRPQVGTPGYIIALLNQIVRLSCVNVKLEA